MRLTTLLVVLAACGGGDERSAQDQQAEAAFFAHYAKLQTLQQQALGAGAARAAPGNTISYSGPCTGGGTASMQGSYSGDATTGQATFTLDSTFTACVEAPDTLDGTSHWTSVRDGTSYAQTIHDDLSFAGSTYTGHIVYDVVITLDTSVPSYAVTGSYTIGGKTYAVSGWTFTGG